MTATENIEIIKKHLNDRVLISPKGPVHVRLRMRYGKIYIFREDQDLILRKLQEDGYIKNVTMDKDQRGLTYERGTGISETPNITIPEKFTITLKDREIRINNFLLAKPYATGKNMSFFEYFFEHPDVEIDREEMPDYLKKEVSGKSFVKVLNAIGFTGEILKAFFPKRGKGSALFRKEITKDELEKNGINLDVFLQELRLAEVRSSPK